MNRAASLEQFKDIKKPQFASALGKYNNSRYSTEALAKVTDSNNGMTDAPPLTI